MGVTVATDAELAAAVGRVGQLETDTRAMRDGLVSVRGQVGELREVVGRLSARVAVLEGGQPPAPVPGLAGSRRIRREGTRLVVDGRRWRAAGMNWDQAAGCGLAGSQPSAAQADRYFTELNPGSLTRVWVLPGMPNFRWETYDLLVEAARRHGQYLCVCLLNGQPDCTSRRASYEVPVAADIADWVRRVVGRHRGDPTVAVVEPANEADEGHTNIVRWYGAMAELIKSVDPDVLVGTGGGNNSSDPARIAAFAAHPAVDLISYHDYYTGWESRAPRAGVFEDAAGRAGKPWYFGEVGACCGGWNGGSHAENGRRLGTVYSLHLGMERCAGVLYWDFKLVQPEASTANFGNALWRAACDFRVAV